VTRPPRLALLGLLGLGAATAAADPAAKPESKKDREWATKSLHHGAPPEAGTKPAPLLNVYNEHLHEWLPVDPHDPPTQGTLDHVLRDHFTNQATKVDARLLDILVAAAAKFRGDTVFVVSGFRHPKYNLMLRKKGHQVARDSQHTHGNAVDFYLPRVPTMVLHAWAKQQKLGGVGLYLDSGFVHMDFGKIRYWSGE